MDNESHYLEAEFSDIIRNNYASTEVLLLLRAPSIVMRYTPSGQYRVNLSPAGVLKLFDSGLQLNTTRYTYSWFTNIVTKG